MNVLRHSHGLRPNAAFAPVMFLIGSIAIAGVLLVVSGTLNARADTNGPVTQSYLNEGCGIDFSSTVTYTKVTSPFVATVTNTRFEGRKADNGPFVYFQKWKHRQTLWREWNGSSWVTVESSSSGTYRSTGSCPGPVLDPWEFTDDKTLEGGALVQIRLKHQFCTNPFCVGSPNPIFIESEWNDHFLE